MSEDASPNKKYVPPELAGTTADPAWLLGMWRKSERRTRGALDHAARMQAECEAAKHKYASVIGQPAWKKVEEADKEIARLSAENARLEKLLLARSGEVDRLDELRMKHAEKAARCLEQLEDAKYVIRSLGGVA